MRRWPVVFVAAALLAGCATTPAPSPVPTGGNVPSSSPAATARATPQPVPSASGPPAPTDAAACVDATLARLTEAQAIGQLFMVGLPDDQLDDATTAAIVDAHLGSVVFTTQTRAGVRAVRRAMDAVQRLATSDATAGIGFLVAANQEGGTIQGLAGPGFETIPSALDQGELRPSVLRVDAARWARQLHDAGINVDLAPVADVVPPGTDRQNAPIGALRREYGHDPATVASHVAAFIRGMTASGVATTAKHFPGLGRVIGNTDNTSDVVDDVTTRHDADLAPFSRAVAAGVPFVMVSLATYERLDPDHLAVFSKTVIDGMLRDDLGFDGVVVSDALGAAAVASIPPATRAIEFIRAGGDLIISNQAVPTVEMAGALRDQAATDPALRDRIGDAVRHVLTEKANLGLLPC